MILYMTSSPTGTYRSNEPKLYKGFNPQNRFVELLKNDWKENSKCLLVAARPDAFETNDQMLLYFKQILDETELSYSEFHLCDDRSERLSENDICSYDFILFGGGHVPTMNEFLHRIGLIPGVRMFDGIAMGISAGSMNCAETVYAQPEMPGETVDPDYNKYLEGLGFTKYQILPHYQAVKDDYIDGKRLMEDVTYADSFGQKFYAIVDGSFLRQDDKMAEIYGEAYLVEDGRIKQVNHENKALLLD